MVAPVEWFMTPNKGNGVRIKEAINEGTYIMEYLGEIIHENEYKERMNSIYKSDTYFYGMRLGDKLVIDSRKMGNLSRFVNHSCDANCKVEKWEVDGQSRVALFSKRNIQAHEELTFDYDFLSFNRVDVTTTTVVEEFMRSHYASSL